jgi:hypothetical protein
MQNTKYIHVYTFFRPGQPCAVPNNKIVLFQVQGSQPENRIIRRIREASFEQKKRRRAVPSITENESVQ